ncbi:MAG: nitroreductase family protein [Anaerolineae bacterium]|nr:nitroreductase family protein [Anaerolineae bacterium]
MDIYQAILNRRSVRRYRDVPVSKQLLARIDDVIAHHVTPLVAQNRFAVMRRDVMTGEDLIVAMGGYGRILSPPHFLTPYIIGDQYPLVDLGYRMEQIAIHMVQLGISVCFIGSLGRETDVRIRFRLMRQARTAAFLLFGYPAETIAGRAMNAVFRRRQQSNTKLAADRIFYHQTFDRMQLPPAQIAQLIEAGRLAPSANNAQPWRFLWLNQHLYLFVREHNPRYGNQAVHQQYRFFDAGTCMSNITLAMKGLEMKGYWSLLTEDVQGVPQHPPSLRPIAKLTLE